MKTYLRSAALLGALAAAAAKDHAKSTAADEIQHVVLLLMENRPFDMYVFPAERNHFALSI